MALRSPTHGHVSRFHRQGFPQHSVDEAVGGGGSPAAVYPKVVEGHVYDLTRKYVDAPGRAQSATSGDVRYEAGDDAAARGSGEVLGGTRMRAGAERRFDDCKV